MKNAGQIQEADEQTKLNLEELMRKYDTESRFRILSGWQGKLVALIAVAMSCRGSAFCSRRNREPSISPSRWRSSSCFTPHRPNNPKQAAYRSMTSFSAR